MSVKPASAGGRIAGFIFSKTCGVMIFNFVSAVGLVTVNKKVFYEYGFKFSSLLTVLHFLTTLLGLTVMKHFGYFKPESMKLNDVLVLAGSFAGFVIFNNLSLAYNSVGFYQVMKTLTTPVILLLQRTFFDVRIDRRLVISLIPIVVGVMLVTGSDVQFNVLGLFFSVLGVVSTSYYQVFVKQRTKDMEAAAVLYAQVPPSIVLVGLFSLCTEPSTRPQDGWLNFPMTVELAQWIAVSCVLAFLLNCSIFLVIDCSSPIAYNVLGHFKLSVILVTGVMLFGEVVGPVKLMGTVMVFIGVVWYSYLKLMRKASSGWEDKQKVSGDVEAGAEDTMPLVSDAEHRGEWPLNGPLPASHREV